MAEMTRENYRTIARVLHAVHQRRAARLAVEKAVKREEEEQTMALREKVDLGQRDGDAPSGVGLVAEPTVLRPVVPRGGLR